MSVQAWAALTDVGRTRDHNEDSVLARSPIFGVADGVGGASAGEVASELALKHTYEALPAPSSITVAKIQELLKQAVIDANASIRKAQQETPHAANMATTLTLAVVASPRTVVIAHVGDSRAYLVQPDAIQQLTDDHSFVAELVRSGQISSEEAHDHPQRNVITRALGAADDVDVDVFTTTVPSDAMLLLCSDGLTSHVSDEQIRELVSTSLDPDDAARKLVTAANAGGGSDNISVVLVKTLARSTDAIDEPGDTERNPAEDTSGNLILERLHAPGEDHGAAQALAGSTSDPVPEAFWEAAHDTDDLHKDPLAPEKTGRQRPWKLVLITAAAIVLVFLTTAWLWSNTFIIVERSDGTIGIDRGFPIDGLHIEHVRYDILGEDLTPADRDRLLNNSPRSFDTASALIADIEEADAS